MNKEMLKAMIKKVIIENREKSLVLYETYEPKYDRLMDILEGNTDIATVGIMSGQNPMATAISPEENIELKDKLEQKVKSQGLGSIRIGGIFGGHLEKSLVVLNPDIDQMEILNREFNQWGFVFGEKIPMNRTESFMAFTMYAIDYDNPMGYRKAPGSKQTGFVVKNIELKGAEDNVSFDPTSKKKFGLELYEVDDDL